MTQPTVAIVGTGSVGRAIGRRLVLGGWPVSAVAARTWRSARDGARFIGGPVRAARTAASAARGADVALIAVSDRAIQDVCESVARAKAWRPGSVALHFSGAGGPELLASARACGVAVGALHPIQSFASAEQAVKRIKGSWFTFAGDDAAAGVARSLVRAVGGRWVKTAPRNRALYHAALCVFSNYLVALADMGRRLLGEAGLSDREAVEAALPLLRGTVENIAAVGPEQALTGPVARGDVATVEAHLAELARMSPELARLYCALGRHTVDVGLRKGSLAADAASELLRLFKI